MLHRPSSAFLIELVIDQHLLVPLAPNKSLSTIFHYMKGDYTEDRARLSKRCRVKGHGVLVTTCNKGWQLAVREIALGHEEAALHHESGEALEKVARESFGISTPGCFQNSTRWAPWQTGILLKLTLLWHDLQNPFQLNFPMILGTLFHLGHYNSALTSPEAVLLWKILIFLFQ